MKVDFCESFKKDLRRIDDENVKARTREVIELIKSARDIHSIRNLKKIKGEKPY